MKTINSRFRPLILASSIIALFAIASCNDDDDGNVGTPPPPSWTVNLSAQYQVPALRNRPETGILQLTQIEGTTKLAYTITVYNLSSTDVITMAHFHAGDALTNGPIIFDFEPVFEGSTATGTFTFPQSFIDSLKNSSIDIYFNIHSQEAPNGLVRGQVNTEILMAADLTLVGSLQIPPVETSAMGTAIIRLTANKILYSKITVEELEVDDELTMAHIHSGTSDVNGDVLVMLCETASDFGVNKMQQLNDAIFNSIMNTSVYVNVHSILYPSGVIRAQLATKIVAPEPDPDPGSGPDPYEN